jgi:hypothetical protein
MHISPVNSRAVGTANLNKDSYHKDPLETSTLLESRMGTATDNQKVLYKELLDIMKGRAIITEQRLKELGIEISPEYGFLSMSLGSFKLTLGHREEMKIISSNRPDYRKGDPKFAKNLFTYKTKASPPLSSLKDLALKLQAQIDSASKSENK